MTEYLSRAEKKQKPRMVDANPYRPEVEGNLLSMGRVEIDNTLCNGCKLCVQACPANTLEMTGKKSVAMKGQNPICIGCGDCVPICLTKAISLTRFPDYRGLYKFIGRGMASEPRRF